MLVALGLFTPILREVRETLYQWERSWVVDDSKFRTAFRSGATDVDETIRQTRLVRSAVGGTGESSTWEGWIRPEAT